MLNILAKKNQKWQQSPKMIKIRKTYFHNKTTYKDVGNDFGNLKNYVSHKNQLSQHILLFNMFLLIYAVKCNFIPIMVKKRLRLKLTHEKLFGMLLKNKKKMRKLKWCSSKILRVYKFLKHWKLHQNIDPNPKDVFYFW